MCFCCRAVKTVLGESCSAEDQGQALLFLSISWGVGTTIGPTIGGVLAKPCDKFHHMPLCGEGELFQNTFATPAVAASQAPCRYVSYREISALEQLQAGNGALLLHWMHIRIACAVAHLKSILLCSPQPVSATLPRYEFCIPDCHHHHRFRDGRDTEEARESSG